MCSVFSLLFCPIFRRKKICPFESAPVCPLLLRSPLESCLAFIRLFTQLSCVFFLILRWNFLFYNFYFLRPLLTALFPPSFPDFVRSKGDPVGDYCWCFFRLIGRNSDFHSLFNRSRLHSCYLLEPGRIFASKVSWASVFIVRATNSYIRSFIYFHLFSGILEPFISTCSHFSWSLTLLDILFHHHETQRHV